LWTWIAAGGAVALIGGGAIAGRSADAAFERYQAARTLEEWERERAATQRHALIANTCFVGAGVAAIAATILFFVEGGERQVIVSTPPSGVGAMVIGRF
jgi:hypothetical protein